MDGAIVELTPELIAAAHALNQQFTTELSSTTPEEFEKLVGVAVYARCIGRADRLDGFLMAFDQATPGNGENLDWFRSRYPHILYIDRVAVAAHARRRGLARTLYSDIIAWAAHRRYPLIGCEVNVRPPNAASHAFHVRLGFIGITERELPNGKRVRYLVRELAGAGT